MTAATATPLNPPLGSHVVGLVRFRDGRIVGFAVGRHDPAQPFRATAWRGEGHQIGDRIVPPHLLTPAELVYCRAFKLDGVERGRGRFLADYFPPPAVGG
jgi:hypothetical protein